MSKSLMYCSLTLAGAGQFQGLVCRGLSGSCLICPALALHRYLANWVNDIIDIVEVPVSSSCSNSRKKNYFKGIFFVVDLYQFSQLALLSLLYLHVLNHWFVLCRYLFLGCEVHRVAAAHPKIKLPASTADHTARLHITRMLVSRSYQNLFLTHCEL